MSTPVATLLPLTSLKSFSAQVDFLDWLRQTKQSGWQFLPVSEPLDFPYRGDGIGLAPAFLDRHLPPANRQLLLDYQEFITANRSWLLDYALFRALAEKYQTDCWWSWPAPLARHQEAALIACRQELAPRLDYYYQQQFALLNQFLQLKTEADQRQLTLIGDLPFYLRQESPLVWAKQKLFLLQHDGRLQFQSGVPALTDEPFAAQFWGHPLYNWADNDWHEIADLFVLRLKFLANFCSLVRLDHANGFFRYGIMSADHPRWSKKVDGPGRVAVKYLLRQTQALKLGIFFENIASDRVRLDQFMKEYQVAGMKVLTLLYNVENSNPAAYQEQITDHQLKLSQLIGNDVVYTSTHDTPPLMTWVEQLPAEIKERLLKVNRLGYRFNNQQIGNILRQEILDLKAKLIIVPWQDWQLDHHRFNVPGHEDLTNWNYFVDPNHYLKKKST